MNGFNILMLSTVIFVVVIVLLSIFLGRYTANKRLKQGFFNSFGVVFNDRNAQNCISAVISQKKENLNRIIKDAIEVLREAEIQKHLPGFSLLTYWIDQSSKVGRAQKELADLTDLAEGFGYKIIE